MIAARNLSKSFGKVVAVDSISFTIPRGRVVGFLGPNGAGKTTTIRMIAGFLPPSAGTVEVASMDVREHPIEVRRRIGYLPETTPLYAEMRVVEYLRFRARLFGIAPSRRSSAVERALARCWLRDVKRRPIRHLSKGYRQRVGLAAALLHEPPVLILDEPTVGLDPTQIREARSLIRELAGSHTILLSTHILSEVEQSCDEIIVIARGRIQAQGPVDDLRRSASALARYLVETDLARAKELLGAIAGVADVEERASEPGWIRLAIVPDAAHGASDLREAIGRTLKAHGAVVRRLERETPSLEQLFVQLIARAEMERPAAAAPAAGVGEAGRA